jgi:hypothetical protein
LANCAAGVYFLEVNGDRREVVRLMKQ